MDIQLLIQHLTPVRPLKEEDLVEYGQLTNLPELTLTERIRRNALATKIFGQSTIYEEI
jgi:hypothetical protein